MVTNLIKVKGYNQKYLKKSFTLIELMVVIAILTITAGLTTSVIVSITRSYSKTQITNELEQAAGFASQKLTKELRNAVAITNISSTSISFSDHTNDVITYRVNANQLQRRSQLAGTAFRALTDTNTTSVSCPSGCFSELNSNPKVISIKMKFTSAGTEGGTAFTGSVDINDTVVVRGTY